jgi:hypothetical protein
LSWLLWEPSASALCWRANPGIEATRGTIGKEGREAAAADLVGMTRKMEKKEQFNVRSVEIGCTE